MTMTVALCVTYLSKSQTKLEIGPNALQNEDFVCTTCNNPTYRESTTSSLVARWHGPTLRGNVGILVLVALTVAEDH